MKIKIFFLSLRENRLKQANLRGIRAMRKVENSQMEFGEIAIGEIHIEVKSRDDIPAVFKGFQYIYTDPQIRRWIIALLTDQVRRAPI